MILEINPARWSIFHKKAIVVPDGGYPPMSKPPRTPNATGTVLLKPYETLIPSSVMSAKAEENTMSTNATPIASAPAPAATQELPVPAATTATAAVHHNAFISALIHVGKLFEKGLVWAVQYAVPVERLVALLLPAAAPAAQGVATATALIQNAVLLVEQKYAASGAQNGTGKQKLAEVLLLTRDAVISLLKQEGITADSAYVESLITAVVGILNAQVAPTA